MDLKEPTSCRPENGSGRLFVLSSCESALMIAMANLLADAGKVVILACRNLNAAVELRDQIKARWGQAYLEDEMRLEVGCDVTVLVDDTDCPIRINFGKYPANSNVIHLIGATPMDTVVEDREICFEAARGTRHNFIFWDVAEDTRFHAEITKLFQVLMMVSNSDEAGMTVLVKSGMSSGLRMPAALYPSPTNFCAPAMPPYRVPV